MKQVFLFSILFLVLQTQANAQCGGLDSKALAICNFPSSPQDSCDIPECQDYFDALGVVTPEIKKYYYKGEYNAVFVTPEGDVFYLVECEGLECKYKRVYMSLAAK